MYAPTLIMRGTILTRAHSLSRSGRGRETWALVVLVAASEGLCAVVLRLRAQHIFTLGPRLRGGTVFAFPISVFSSFVMPDLIRHLGRQALWLAG